MKYLRISHELLSGFLLSQAALAGRSGGLTLRRVGRWPQINLQRKDRASGYAPTTSFGGSVIVGIPILGRCPNLDN